jgi:hypothetical protein
MMEIGVGQEKTRLRTLSKLRDAAPHSSAAQATLALFGSELMDVTPARLFPQMDPNRALWTGQISMPDGRLMSVEQVPKVSPDDALQAQGSSDTNMMNHSPIKQEGDLFEADPLGLGTNLSPAFTSPVSGVDRFSAASSDGDGFGGVGSDYDDDEFHGQHSSPDFAAGPANFGHELQPATPPRLSTPRRRPRAPRVDRFTKLGRQDQFGILNLETDRIGESSSESSDSDGDGSGDDNEDGKESTSHVLEDEVETVAVASAVDGDGGHATGGAARDGSEDGNIDDHDQDSERDGSDDEDTVHFPPLCQTTLPGTHFAQVDESGTSFSYYRSEEYQRRFGWDPLIPKEGAFAAPGGLSNRPNSFLASGEGPTYFHEKRENCPVRTSTVTLPRLSKWLQPSLESWFRKVLPGHAQQKAAAAKTLGELPMFAATPGPHFGGTKLVAASSSPAGPTRLFATPVSAAASSNRKHRYQTGSGTGAFGAEGVEDVGADGDNDGDDESDHGFGRDDDGEADQASAMDWMGNGRKPLAEVEVGRAAGAENASPTPSFGSEDLDEANNMLLERRWRSLPWSNQSVGSRASISPVRSISSSTNASSGGQHSRSSGGAGRRRRLPPGSSGRAHGSPPGSLGSISKRLDMDELATSVGFATDGAAEENDDSIELSLLEQFEPTRDEFDPDAAATEIDSGLVADMKSFYWFLSDLSDADKKIEFFSEVVVEGTSTRTVAACAFSNLLHLASLGAVAVEQKSPKELWVQLGEPTTGLD